MKKSILIILATALFLSPQVKAQFTVDAEVRPRGEIFYNKKKLPIKDVSKAVFSISQRTRINTGYKSKWIDIYVSLQDIRTWGNAPQLTSVSGATTWLHQAYGVGHITKWLDIKFGRQEINLDDARIMGNVGWAQQARSHDAALLQFKPDGKTKIDFGVAYNPTKVTTPGGNYKTFQYLWLNRKFGKVQASVLFLNNGKQVTSTLATDSVEHVTYTPTDTISNWVGFNQDKVYFTQTIGTRVGYAGEKFSAFGAFYYQLGNNGGFSAVANDSISDVTITKRKTNAMLARLDVMGKLGPVTLSGGYEYQSGNSQVSPVAGEDRAFSPFYGTNHKFNGLADYFYVGNHFGSVGLHNAFLGVKFAHKGFWIGATGHYFAAAGDVADLTTGTAMKSSLGGELDILLGYKVSPTLIFAAGYSQVFASNTLKTLRGADPNNGIAVSDVSSNGSWGFIQVIFKPKLFNSDNYQLKKKEAAKKAG
ncbi:MAG: hypothetical protein QF371_04425 [Flavobacteriales bacterium]|nr:hypothetical protein [Flavobacteriales bacterium]